jgi:Domain of unknown function (DUF4126)
LQDIRSMEVLETLSVALGLATLAGINLYLTVFVTGMAVHFGWVVLPSNLQDLLVLGDPWVIAIAGVLYFMEFFADKIPWVDSANDALHTFIRPLGGALLAVLALGQADPSIKVIAALLAGGAALTAHAAKAGTRLVANFSPEPISNIGLSLGGDALVLGGLGLLLWHPIVALIVAIVALGLTWTFLPSLLRGVRATLWLAWRKVLAITQGSTGLPNELPAAFRGTLHREGVAVEIAAPCIIGAGPVKPKGILGWLARLSDGRLLFISSRGGSSRVHEVPLAGSLPERESRFLCEKVLIFPPSGKPYEFVFETGSGATVDQIVRTAKRLGNEKGAAMAA